MNILIMDDSPTVRLMMKKVITSEFPQANVVEHNNAKDGFKELTKQGFDLIVTDLNMGEVKGSGNNFLMKIKGSAILKKKPVIVFSSENTDSLKKMFPEVVFVSKDKGPKVFLEAVKSILNK